MITLLLIAACSHPSPSSPNPSSPNIVLIVADDLGWSDVVCYGADLHQTPHLDRLAKQGMRFTNAYSASPVCSPTRASILTGKCPARLHMTIWFEAAKHPPRDRRLIPPVAVNNLPHAETTLADLLQSAGYTTAHVGKWHLGDAAHYPETHGFDITIGGTFWGAPATFFAPYRGAFGSEREFRYVPDLPWPTDGEYLTDRLTDEAIQVIERAGDRPFFLYLAYHSVHTPIEAKAPVVERYRQRLSAGLRHQNTTYAAMVESLDENVGRLLQKIDQLQLADNTIVVFTSDNGGQIGDYAGHQVTSNAPLRSGKGSLYEGGVRVPLMVRWPHIVSASSTCNTPVVSTDLYPTIAQIAEVALGEHNVEQLDGRSLLPSFRDPNASLARDAIFFHYPHYYSTTTPVSAIRVGNWKMLEYFENSRVELYDLEEDLGETTDLSAQRPEKTAELRHQLRAWRQQVGAQMPKETRSASEGVRYEPRRR